MQYNHLEIAQLVERRTVNPQVEGSTPSFETQTIISSISHPGHTLSPIRIMRISSFTRKML